MIFGKTQCAAMSNLQCYYRDKIRDILYKESDDLFSSTCTSLYCMHDRLLLNFSFYNSRQRKIEYFCNLKTDAREYDNEI